MLMVVRTSSSRRGFLKKAKPVTAEQWKKAVRDQSKGIWTKGEMGGLPSRFEVLKHKEKAGYFWGSKREVQSQLRRYLIGDVKEIKNLGSNVINSGMTKREFNAFVDKFGKDTGPVSRGWLKTNYDKWKKEFS